MVGLRLEHWTEEGSGHEGPQTSTSTTTLTTEDPQAQGPQIGECLENNKFRYLREHTVECVYWTEPKATCRLHRNPAKCV